MLGKLSSIKLSSEVFWNLGSLVILALSGIGMNVLIARVYGASVLGVFNQVLTLYIFISQLAVLGLDRSVLRAFAIMQESDGPKEYRSILLSASGLGVFFGSLSGLLVYSSSSLWGHFFDSPDVVEGLKWIAPGLLFFSLNKIGFAALNGLSWMKVYSVFQSLRFILIFAGIAVICYTNFLPSPQLPAAFTVAEIILFLMFLPVLWKAALEGRFNRIKYWMSEHLDFGVKSFLSGVLVEINTRVDILILGYMSGDNIVGIYSFAAMFAEGFFQVIVVFQNFINPQLAKFKVGDVGLLFRTVKGYQDQASILTGVLAIASCIFFPFVVMFVGNQHGFTESWAVYAVLAVSIAVSSRYLILSQIFLMNNRPIAHTVLMLSIILVNVCGNLIFVPTYGALGAAIGTAVAFLYAFIVIRWFSKRLLYDKV